MKKILLPPHLERAKLKSRVENWIGQLIQIDSRNGRDRSNFDAEKIANLTRVQMKEKGFDTYHGGGNLFYVKYNASGPIVMQTRMLAQRVVRPHFLED